MTDSGDPSDDALRKLWATELASTGSDEEAAWLPATMQAVHRAWARFSAGATVLLAEAGRQTAAARHSAEAVVRDVVPAAGQLLLAASQAAAVTYAEHLNDRYRRADQALNARGWWALSSWKDDELDEFAQLARSLARREFSREICGRYRADDGRRLRRLIRGWSDEPAFRIRRPIVRDALVDHLARRYRVSVPTLMPCLEGAVAESIGLGRKVSVPQGLEYLVDLFDGLDMLGLNVALDSLGALYGRVDFSDAPALSPRLNRHLILHGRIIRVRDRGEFAKGLSPPR